MKTLYFDTDRVHMVGGGGLALYNLSVALQELYEVHLAHPWNSDMEKYEFLREPSRPFKIGKPTQIDVFVASKSAEWSVSQGVKNVFYCFYPRFTLAVPGYHKILTVSEYSARAIRELWSMESEILVGGAFYPDYQPELPKKNSFVSCSGFFMEGDSEKLSGCSNNQHLLIQAFQTLPKECPWTLTLAGPVLRDDGQRYLDKCRGWADGNPKISFVPNATKEELKMLYGYAKILLHAETDCYGLCVEKALLSGCATIAHKSGGAPELAHATWETPEELAGLMKMATDWSIFDVEEIVERNRRTWDTFSHQVKTVFSNI